MKDKKDKSDLQDIYLSYPSVEDMDRDELERFIDDLDLEIDPSEYDNTKSLRKAIMDLLGMG
jgi:hypothetical protein